MKNKSKELDVDFIGDGKPLTKQEEQRISDFIRNYKRDSPAKSAEKLNKKTEKMN
ncbi:hypothetical protein [uncultured Chryseobacterium sp.]|uniref:hypothetical protein n=1 Tax=uncultured Chryseobacterium sp. TaxID=259322 RepID=UPI0025CBA469|nr:hypothetical protein [uncultured Chryseobacterium sp.]